MDDLSKLEQVPVTFQALTDQALTDYFGKLGDANPFNLRKETFRRIERITERPLISYVTKTHHLAQGIPAYIDDSDLIGFGDLTQSISGDAVDIFIVSNGGSAEAAERIGRLLRERFKKIVKNVEEIQGLADLVRSLYNQYELWFDKTSFYKMFENAHGIGWGRQTQAVTLQFPMLTPAGIPVPQPGPPQQSG